MGLTEKTAHRRSARDLCYIITQTLIKPKFFKLNWVKPCVSGSRVAHPATSGSGARVDTSQEGQGHPPASTRKGSGTGSPVSSCSLLYHNIESGFPTTCSDLQSSAAPVKTSLILSPFWMYWCSLLMYQYQWQQTSLDVSIPTYKCDTDYGQKICNT